MSWSVCGTVHRDAGDSADSVYAVSYGSLPFRGCGEGHPDRAAV